MTNVPQNLSFVREKIRNACLKRAVEHQNREPRLVAVSKIQRKELIIEAYKCGQRHFGENYVNEIVEKSTDEEILKTCPEIQWHFIGHLQRNKVNKLLTVPNLFVIETVDSEKLADALNNGMQKLHPSNDKKLNVFIQVNTSGEQTKSGCHPDETTKLVKHALENCKHLNVMGVMTIGKYDNYDSKDEVNPDFECLLNCRTTVCKDLNIDINDFEVSMGMSGDFEHAVEVGATNVRVGTLIFGARPYSLKDKKKYNLEIEGEEEEKKPYQILIDGTICVAALKNKISIQEQFNKYLDGDIKLLTTQCIVKEVEKLGPATFGALLIVKKFGTHQCGHGKSPVPASDCILHMIGEKNDSRYIIASQDRELQEQCRRIEGVPLLYLHSRTPTLEPPSTLTRSVAEEKSFGGFQVSETEKEKLAALKSGEEVEGTVGKKRKKKGGPNPLSCKKKKTKDGAKTKNSNPNRKKRKRNRSRLVKKIKNEIMTSLNS